MLDHALKYEEMYESFRWQFPDRYNMGFDVCDKWSDREPDRTAIIDLTSGIRKDISFSKLKGLSNQLANRLTALGVTEGDRVAVLRSQSVWTAAAHIAVWKMAAISMPLFMLFGEEALISRLSDSGAKAVVTDQQGLRKLEKLRDQLPNLRYVIVPEIDGVDEVSEEFEVADTTPDTPGLIIYTSGTTGAPKGALHGHRVLRGHLPGVEMSHDLLPQPGDVLWSPADWAWIGGLLDVLMPGLYHGVPVVAASISKFSGAECRRIIEQAGVRNIFFPPTALRMLRAENTILSGLRTVASGGEPLGEEMLDWGRKALGLTINEFYGQTECNMVLSSCSTMFDPKPGFIGRPVPGHIVDVIDEDGESTDEEGDIAIRRGTAVMMLEYWNNPGATKQKFRNGWLLTGDRGKKDGDFVRFIGRDDDVITSAGYRIGPSEIEDCLLRHESVATVGVIGKPDRERTEIVKAYIVLRKGVVPSRELKSELQTYVRAQLSAHEYPREVEFVDSLPMTVTGKIIRKELKARAISELESA